MSNKDKTYIGNKSLQQYKMFSETLPIANVILEYKDKEWLVLGFNEMVCEITGYSKIECESKLKHTPWDFIDPIENDKLKNLLNDLLDEEKKTSNKLVIKSDRKESYVKIVASLLERSDGYALVSCVITDLTQREKEKRELRKCYEENNVLGSLTKTTKQYILKYDFTTDRFEPYNNLSKSLLYQDKKVLTNWKFSNNEFIESDSQSLVRNFFHKLKAGVPSGSVVFKTMDKYGQANWYQGKYTTVFSDNRRARHSIIYFKNITDIRKNGMGSKRFQDFTGIGANQTFLNIEYNMTTDMIENIEGEQPDGYDFNLEMTVQEIIYLNTKNVHPEDRNEFKRALSIGRILASFSKGLNRGCLDFRYKFKAEYKWIGLLYHVLKDPYTSNIILWIHCSKIDEKKKAELKLAARAELDEVTGLYIRSVFKDKAIKLIEQSSEKLPSALVMVNIDNFRRVNEEFGFEYGDIVLRDVARSIRLILGESDIIGRFRGSNFLIYSHDNLDMETLERKLALIDMVVSRETKEDITLSVSMGVAIYGHDAKDFDELCEKAEVALTNSKLSPDNNYTFYKEGLVKQKTSKFAYSKVAYNKQIEAYPHKVRVEIRTFGYFDVLIDGQAILIPSGKSKELLALLVHRKGGFVTPREIIAYLWEDEEYNKVTLARYRKIFMLLKDVLKEYGIDDILESARGARRIVAEKINCDLYNYLSGDDQYANLYNGHYMLNYSWAEHEMAELAEEDIFLRG